jgi:hypothetical protein
VRFSTSPPGPTHHARWLVLQASNSLLLEYTNYTISCLVFYVSPDIIRYGSGYHCPGGPETQFCLLRILHVSNVSSLGRPYFANINEDISPLLVQFCRHFLLFASRACREENCQLLLLRESARLALVAASFSIGKEGFRPVFEAHGEFFHAFASWGG